jgi:single-stranded-DNA-specific exonuclease
MAAPGRAFLNVEESFLGRPWRDRLTVEAQGRAEAMTRLYGHPDILARVLAGRGVAPEEAETFLAPTIRALMPDPDILRDMDALVDRLSVAIKARDRVAIFGDYDVDGACASALVGGFLGVCGVPYEIYIPDRIFEGYGPNSEAIRGLAAKGATLLVTVDCGTASHEPIAEARRLGLDTLVIDHHQAPETLPEAVAIVNPNRQDDLSGLGQLCATGVAFMVLVALNRRLRRDGFWTLSRPEPDLMQQLDLVALATVADVVPLTGLNRAFVSRGLEVMRRRERQGLRALFDASRASGPPTSYQLGFMIGPRINAGGRIGDAALGARLLLEQDPTEADRVAVELDRLNGERQVIERAAVEEALGEAWASLGEGDQGAIVVTARDGWHPGVVGLVASRLKDRFRRPAFAIAFMGENGTGSGRSILGVDLGKAVRAAVDAGILVKGGGHAMAAGITIPRAKLGDFRAFLEERLQETVAAARLDQTLSIDAALTAGGARPDLIEMVEKAGPFGSGNPEPVFAFPAHRLIEVAEVGTGHLRLRAKSGDGSIISGIAFRVANEALGKALLACRGEAVHLAGHLAIDRWGNGERVQLRLVDAARPLAGGL